MTSNTEVVQRALAAFGSGDVAAVLECLAEDADFDEPNPAEGSLRKHTTSAQEHGVPWVQPTRGKQAIEQHLNRILRESLDISKFEVVRLVGSGDVVVAFEEMEARVRQTGMPFVSEPLYACTLRGGRIQSVLQYLDTAKAIDVCTEQDAAGAGVHAGEGI